MSYDKVYKQGFNINTPIDLNLQTIATKSLRDGLVVYDKRKGWRGPLTNKIYNSEWKKDLEKYKLENSTNWKLAIVKKVNKFSADICLFPLSKISLAKTLRCFVDLIPFFSNLLMALL